MLADQPHLVRQIRASITAGIRPCAMVLHEQPSRPWRELDFKLIEAYQILQDEVCPKCGQPSWLCRTKSRDIGWKIETTVCYATKAIDESQWRTANARADKKNKKRAPSKDEIQDWGRIEYPKPYLLPNAKSDKLPSRADYMTELAEDAKVE